MKSGAALLTLASLLAAGCGGTTTLQVRNDYSRSANVYLKQDNNVVVAEFKGVAANSLSEPQSFPSGKYRVSAFFDGLQTDSVDPGRELSFSKGDQILRVIPSGTEVE